MKFRLYSSDIVFHNDQLGWFNIFPFISHFIHLDYIFIDHCVFGILIGFGLKETLGSRSIGAGNCFRIALFIILYIL